MAAPAFGETVLLVWPITSSHIKRLKVFLTLNGKLFPPLCFLPSTVFALPRHPLLSFSVSFSLSPALFLSVSATGTGRFGWQQAGMQPEWAE